MKKRGIPTPGDATLSVKKRTAASAIWDFFCSLKLTIVTLILLAVTSIIGTVIQQNLSPRQYLRVYSETTYRILSSLDFFDMYHSWWFLGLLALFTANLVACSIKRFPRVWKTVKNPVLAPEDTLYRTFSNFEEVVVKAAPSEVRKKLEAFLARRFAAPVVTEKEGKIHLFSQKGAYARFSVYITHLSIIIIFIGAILGSVWGFKGYVNIPEGQQVSQVWPRNGNKPIDLGFAVRCDSFAVSYYPGTDRPKEFKSVLTVLQNGKAVPGFDHHTIIVNKPLTYKNITFYQSGYGPAGNPQLSLTVQVRGTQETRQVSVPVGQQVLLPGGAHLRVADFTPAFKNFGPAAKLEVLPKTGSPRIFVVLQNYPNFDAQRGGPYIFKMTNYRQGYFTGLQVAKDPGVWVVWLGCFLLVLGTICAFYLSHRRIWITLQEVGGKTGIKMGGSAHRNQPSFNLFFDDFKKELKSEISS
jgi:cytochrome c biogenesis protein